MPDLRKRLAVEVGDIIETAIDRRDFVLGQFQRHSLLPELIEGKIVTRLRLLGQERFHLLEACCIDARDTTLIAVVTPMQDLSNSVNRQLNLHHLAHGVLLRREELYLKR